MYRHEALERTLDRCIDRLIGGSSWGDLLPDEPDDRTEMQRLMVVAEMLRQASGDAKPLGPDRRNRVKQMLDRAGVRLMQFIGTLSPPPLAPARQFSG